MPRLTEFSARKAAASQRQYTLWDASLPNFGLRVNPGGSKTWIVMHGPRRERLTIGRYPILSLSVARETARTMLAERTLNKHRPEKIAFEAAVDLFLNTHCTRVKPQTKYGYERVLRRHYLPKLRRVALTDIRDVAWITDALLHTPAEANHVFGVGRTFFRWAVRRKFLTHSPMQGLQLPAKLTPRERVLTDRELLAIWRSAEGQASFGQIVRLCILTGQRRSEVGSLRAEYFDYEAHTVSFPRARTKNGRPHTFPYGPMAADIVAPLPNQGWLFPGRGTDGSFNGWSKSKVAFDKVCCIKHWTLHDLRRTFATNLAQLGVAPHVIERLLNHTTGTISGIAAIYNRYQFLDEMRDAIRRWEMKLCRLIEENRFAA